MLTRAPSAPDVKSHTRQNSNLEIATYCALRAEARKLKYVRCWQVRNVVITSPNTVLVGEKLNSVCFAKGWTMLEVVYKIMLN